MSFDRFFQPRLLNIAAAFVTKGATAGMVFVQSVILGRYLGVEAMGVYFSAIAVYRLAESAAPLGLPKSVLREVGAAHQTQSWQTIRSVAFNALLICTALGCVAALATYLGRNLIASTFDAPVDANVALGWMALAIIPGCGIMALVTVLCGVGRQPMANMLGNFVVALVATLSFVAWLHHGSYVGAIQSFILGQFVAFAAMGFYVWLTVRKGSGIAAHRHSLFHSALPFWIITLASFGNDSLGVLLLGMLGSVSDAGIFGVAARLALPLSYLSASIQSVYEPRFAGLYRTGSIGELRHEFKNSLLHSSIMGLAMLAVMAVLTEPLLALFGHGFTEAKLPFSVMLVGLCVMCALGPAGSMLAMTGKAQYNAWIAIASLPAAVILLVLLIPSYGALGAAAATSGVLIVRTVVQAWAAYIHLLDVSRLKTID